MNCDFYLYLVHDIDDLRNYEDDDVDEVYLDKEVSQAGIPAAVPAIAVAAANAAKVNRMTSLSTLSKNRVRFQSIVEPPSGDLNTMESIASSKHNPIEMESIRKKLCDLVVSNSYIYLVGHLPFVLINTVQKLPSLIAGYNIIDSDNALLAVFHAATNFLLYSSLGLTFFVHLIYNVKFRYVLEKAWKRLCCVKMCCSGNNADAGDPEKADTANVQNKTSEIF